VHDIEPQALPNLLKAANYETFFAGKYMNQYHSKAVPAGWDHFYGLQGNSRYYDYKLNENGQLKYYGVEQEDYLTSVIVSILDGFLSHGTTF
jgi:N-acetylglucosamine-6-sulfatase